MNKSSDFPMPSSLEKQYPIIVGWECCQSTWINMVHDIKLLIDKQQPMLIGQEFCQKYLN